MLEIVREKIKKNHLTLEDVMSECVVMVSQEYSLKSVAHLMLRDRISGVPIVGDGKKLVGIITITDLFRIISEVLDDKCDSSQYSSDDGIKIKYVMTKDVVTVDKATPLEQVVEIMCRDNIHTLPILENGRIAGIVGRHDILNAVF
ncbi:MAG: hypothetical protein DRP78_00470 [Candidatus Omnitrophota bacterium]|nr:MAG: hypothetical protein DRP78_00470 [Candidatus Omnitrophota bacterium]